MPAQNSPGAGQSKLLYDYIVTTATKASIDTNVDGPMAGLFATEFSLLEIWLSGRTDEAVNVSPVDVTLNNDSGSHYDRSLLNTTGGGSPGQVGTNDVKFGLSFPGSSATANAAGLIHLTFPGYADTSLWKVGTILYGNAQDTTAGHYQAVTGIVGFESTAAITRIKAVPDTAAKNFVTGTRLLVYAR